MTQLITIDRATLEQLVAAAQYLTQIVLTNITDYPIETEQRITDWNTHQDAIASGRAALANAEPIARMQPVTKARVGNYLNKHPMGDLAAYRLGFKDGVKWREQL